MKKILDKFEKDFVEYINESIKIAESQKPYKPLDFEDEVAWLRDYIKKILKEQKKLNKKL